MTLTIGDQVRGSRVGIGQERITKNFAVTKMIIDIVVRQEIKVGYDKGV